MKLRAGVISNLGPFFLSLFTEVPLRGVFS